VRHVTTSELARCYPELERYLGECRFTSCTHIPEPGCAVKTAVEARTIAKERYESYRRLFGELRDS